MLDSDTTAACMRFVFAVTSRMWKRRVPISTEYGTNVGHVSSERAASISTQTGCECTQLSSAAGPVEDVSWISGLPV